MNSENFRKITNFFPTRTDLSDTMKVAKMSSTCLDPVNVHLIGISGYARAVLQSLLQVIEPAGGRLASATVINRTEEEESCRLLESRGCRIFSDYGEMLGATEPSARNLCIIPTSIFQHAPMTSPPSRRDTTCWWKNLWQAAWRIVSS